MSNPVTKQDDYYEGEYNGKRFSIDHGPLGWFVAFVDTVTNALGDIVAHPIRDHETKDAKEAENWLRNNLKGK